MIRLPDKNLQKTYAYDRQRLSETAVPIITVAGTFREDLKRLYGMRNSDKTADVVFSRAHFSMALGLAQQAWGTHINPKKAWLVDPTNYVSVQDWQKILLTEAIGKTIARHSVLQLLKEFIDRFGRQKLPILDSITAPLLYLTEEVTRPILCLHIAAGNILATHGKTVVQVITDPHVRLEYLQCAHLPNISFCVFDQKTRIEFLELAALHNVVVEPERIIVTGPPIDQRIIESRQQKVPWRSGPLKLCITTGGIGTNSFEIHQVLRQLLPQLHRDPCPFQILMYAGTQHDIAKMAHHLAEEFHVQVSDVQRIQAKFRIAYHPQILDANELLIKYGFPWADGFLTKPSGDMAYDAAAAGCFLLTLSEWGVWEERIREFFEQHDIARRAEVESILGQLSVLQESRGGKSWIESAMHHALRLDASVTEGNKKILAVVTSTS